MLKEDVKYAKEQYKLALADYCRAKQKWHDANKELDKIQKQKVEIEHQVSTQRFYISELNTEIAVKKRDFMEKQIHWRRLNKEYQFLCNQNSIIDNSKRSKK